MCESVKRCVACVQDFQDADKDGDGIVSVGTFFSQHHPAPLTHIEHMFEISDCFGEVCMLYVGRTSWKHYVAVGTRTVTVAVIAGLCRVV